MKTKKSTPTKTITFKTGDKVKWISSSNGTEKEKRGVIEAVIPAGGRPTEEQRREADAYGYGRNHESYLVRVPGKTERSKGKLYWPLANKLKKA